MIFKEIYIDGFGIYHDFPLKNLKKGVNIIYGENEAGKSTLQKFLKFTLTGYPTKPKKLRMPPLNGGEHQGYILADSLSGEELKLQRTHANNITLLINGRDSSDLNQWSRVTGGATPELYQNIYAFSLDELVNTESFDKSKINDKLFSIGLGLGSVSLQEIQSSIDDDVIDIYKKSRQKTRINEIMNEIKAYKEQISAIQDNLPEYSNLNVQIQELKSKLDEVDLKKNELEKEKKNLERYFSVNTHFISYSSAQDELNSLPEIQSYPEDLAEQHTKICNDLEQTNAQIRTLEEGSLEEEGLKTKRQKKASISYNQILTESSEDIKYIRNNFALYESTVKDKEEAERTIAQSKAAIADKLKEISPDWDEERVNSYSDIIEHRSRVKEFQEDFRDLKEKERQAEIQASMPSAGGKRIDPTVLMITIAIVFFIGSIPAYVYDLPVMAVSLILIALVLILGRKRIVRQNREEGAPDLLPSLKQQKKKLESTYQSFLKDELGFDPEQNTDAVLEKLSRIEIIKTDISNYQQLLAKNENERDLLIQKFESKTLELINSAKLENNGSIASNVHLLTANYDQAVNEKNLAHSLQEEITTMEEKLRILKAALERIQTQERELYKMIEADDEKDFLDKITKNDKVKELLATASSAITNIETITGIGTHEEVFKVLNAMSIPEIESRIIQLGQEISQIESENSEARESLGKKKEKLNSIMGSSELNDLSTKYETARENLQDAYKEWLSGKIALKILTEQREEYELTRQPEVIRKSSSYFSRITDTRYENIGISLEDKTVSAISASGNRKEIEALSRGTREQLLISLRLGYIEDYEQQSEPLPLIMDEVLVNFDPERAAKTAAILHEFAQDRQVLLFTCHPSTKEHFGNLDVNEIKLEAIK